MTQGNQPQQQTINIRPEDTKPVICANPECLCEVFQQCVSIRTVSPIISPTGKEEHITIPVMVCIQCGNPLIGDM